MSSPSEKGSVGEEVEELDGGQFCVCVAGQEAREAHDDDARLGCADEQEEAVCEKIAAELLDAGKLCIIRFPCPESDIVGHRSPAVSPGWAGDLAYIP